MDLRLGERCRCGFCAFRQKKLHHKSISAEKVKSRDAASPRIKARKEFGLASNTMGSLTSLEEKGAGTALLLHAAEAFGGRERFNYLVTYVQHFGK